MRMTKIFVTHGDVKKVKEQQVFLNLRDADH
jgi:hypothetical protein